MGLYAPNCSVSGRFEANKNNSPDIFIVERNWQEVSTKSLLLEIKQVWQEEMQPVAGDHNIIKQEENNEFLITEEKNEHERVAITSNFQTSAKIFVTLDLLKQSIGVASVQQLEKEKYSTQLQAMNVTVNTLTLEEGKKCSQMDIEIGFVNECHIELHEVPRGKAIYRRSALVKTEDRKLKRPVVKLAPLFYESAFREKNRASNVGASHQKAKKLDSEHAG